MHSCTHGSAPGTPAKMVVAMVVEKTFHWLMSVPQSMPCIDCGDSCKPKVHKSTCTIDDKKSVPIMECGIMFKRIWNVPTNKVMVFGDE